MTYEDWLWLKLGLVALAAFVWRFYRGLTDQPPPSRDPLDQDPRR